MKGMNTQGVMITMRGGLWDNAPQSTLMGASTLGISRGVHLMGMALSLLKERFKRANGLQANDMDCSIQCLSMGTRTLGNTNMIKWRGTASMFGVLGDVTKVNL